MSLKIYPIEAQDVTPLVCPACREKVRKVGLLKESQVNGLSFKCHKCSRLWGVKTEYRISKESQNP
jgi:transposase-like protein